MILGNVIYKETLNRVLCLLSVLIEYSRGSSLFQSSSFGFTFHFCVLLFLPSNCPLHLFARTCLSRLLVIILAKKLFTHMIIPRASNLASKLHCDGCYTDH